MHTYDRNYFKIALPAALEGLFMILLASTDLIMVGALGALSIAAVSIFMQPRLILLCFSRSLASSVTLLVSQKAGAGDTNGTSDIMKKSLTLCAIFMGLLHILFYIFLDDIFYLMGANDEYMAEAMAYGPMQLGYGRTSVIMKTNVCGNVVNLALNALLIFGFGPIPSLGVTGAAIGTLVSTIFTLAWTTWILKNESFFSGGSYLPDRAYFHRMMPILLSILSEQGSERVGMVLFSRMAAGLGTIPFAVHSICMNISDVYYDFIMGFGKASMVMAGQSCGKGSEEDWRGYKRCGIKWSLILSAIVCAAILFFGSDIFALFSDDASSLEIASVIMLFVAAVSFPEAHAILSAGILRGSGKAAQVAGYSFLSITFLRPLMTAFFIYVLDLGLIGCWCALLLDQFIRASCATVLLYRLERKGWRALVAGA